jgi:hypothetical protein
MVTKAQRDAKIAEREQQRAIIKEQREWEDKAFNDLVEKKTDFLELVRDPHWPQVGGIDRAKLRTLSMAIRNKNKALINLFLEDRNGAQPFKEIDPADSLLRKWIENTGNQLMLKLYDERVACAFLESMLYDALEGKIVVEPSWIKSINKHGSKLSTLVEKVRLEHPELEDQSAQLGKEVK